jgi:hypothetical protein
VIKPDTDDLLAGIIAAVEADVLPLLPEGGPRRQLRSALHTLSRVQRSWGRLDPYVLADGEDIRATLEVVLRTLAAGGDPAASELAAKLSVAASDDGRPPAAWEAALEELLTAVDAHVRFSPAPDPAARDAALGLLFELYQRMLARQDSAWGTAPTEAS